MSHVGNGEDDFRDMEHFSEEDQEYIKRVRELAREVIDMLEPRRINTYKRLLGILHDAERMIVSFNFLENPERTESHEKTSLIDEFVKLCVK